MLILKLYVISPTVKSVKFYWLTFEKCSSLIYEILGAPSCQESKSMGRLAKLVWKNKNTLYRPEHKGKSPGAQF